MKKLFFVLISLAISGQVVAEESTDEFMTLEQLSEAFNWSFDTPIETEVVAEGLIVLFGVGGNIAVSIGEDGVLVVDDQFPEMIPKVNAAIQEQGGGAIDFAVNTHWHFDHADGNMALGPAGTWIVAHENSAEMVSKDNVVDLVITKYKQKAYPPDARPVISFKDSMTFHFNGGDIELVHAGPAHTAGDVAVIFREQNAVHFGDVYNNMGYPFIDVGSGGGIDGMIRFCEVVRSLIDETTTVIPGHGPITNVADLSAYIEMLKSVRSRVLEEIKKGKSLEEVVAANLTADFDETYGPESGSLGFINRVYTSLTQ